MIVYSGLNYRREIFPWNFAKTNQEFVRITNDLRAIGGTTNTKKALEVGIQLLNQRNTSIPTLVLVVTDGRSADDPKGPGQEIQRMSNTWVFAAATGDPEKVDRRELLDITGNINHIVLHRGRELATDITRRLLRQAQARCEMDLVLILDFSTTTDPVYRFYKEMSQRLVRALRIGPHHTQVAVVTFANVGRTRTKFNLKRFKTQDEVLNAIAGLESHGGTTAIGEAIREGAKQSNEREGARPGIATKVMVVFTDGWSNKGPEPEVTAKEAAAMGYEIYSVSYT
ncbi:von Willebrand factor type A domain protein, partial [Ostertagia ostertagi]